VSSQRNSLAIVILVLCASCATSSSSATSADERLDTPPSWGPVAEDVVLVGGFGRVTALGVSQTRAFVAGDGGVAIYDRLGSRWLVPVPMRGAREILVDRMGRGAYIYANSWWILSSDRTLLPLSPGQTPPRDEVIPSPDAQQILRETPGLQSFGGLLTRDAQLRTWPMTVLARAPERNEIWAGTNGGGVFVVDPVFLRSAQMPYGLRNRSATALALAADGVWIAEESDATAAPDLAITFASADLTTWRWLSAAHDAYAVAAMAVREHYACMSTTIGAIVVDLESSMQPIPRVQSYTQLGDPTSAWATPAGCWVGGTSGFTRLPWPSDSMARATTFSNNSAASAFASSGDTTWIATMAGVRVHVSGATDGEAAAGASHAALLEATPAALPNALRGPIRALTLAGPGLALVTDRELWLTSGRARLSSAVRVDAPVDRLGRIRRITGDERTLWLAGSRGAAAFSLRDHHWRFVTPSGATGPGMFAIDLDRARDVRDVALSARVAWLATAAGVVRIARGADGMPR
jgi:hypothetical protein